MPSISGPDRALCPPPLLDGAVDAIHLSEEVQGDGGKLLAKARSLGLEGIIAKYRNSTYRSGRTGDWLKIKCVQSASFIIVGYEQSATARDGIGSLLLAARRGHDWMFVGKVGTGSRKECGLSEE